MNEMKKIVKGLDINIKMLIFLIPLSAYTLFIGGMDIYFRLNIFSRSADTLIGTIYMVMGLFLLIADISSISRIKRTINLKLEDNIENFYLDTLYSNFNKTINHKSIVFSLIFIMIIVCNETSSIFRFRAMRNGYFGDPIIIANDIILLSILSINSVLYIMIYRNRYSADLKDIKTLTQVFKKRLNINSIILSLNLLFYVDYFIVIFIRMHMPT